MLPAGVAWREAWKRDRSVRLYGRDGFHPGVEGSYLAALVVWGLLTGSSVSSAPASLRLASGAVIELDASEAGLLREAAAAAIMGR